MLITSSIIPQIDEQVWDIFFDDVQLERTQIAEALYEDDLEQMIERGEE